MVLAFVMIAVALVSYLCGGVNGAILLSSLLHHEDIREKGSGNPGFTNYKRVYGGGPATVFVMVFDLLKTALPVLVSSLVALLFREELGLSAFGIEGAWNAWQAGAAFAGLFCQLGHAFPVRYGFRGGKAFLAGAATVWFVDWRMGLIACAVFLFFLFVVKYMSLSSILAAITCPPALLLFSPTLAAELLTCASALLVVARHHKNIGRLLHGTESKFSLFGKKKAE